jgi:hypothetical protein
MKTAEARRYWPAGGLTHIMVQSRLKRFALDTEKIMKGRFQ